MLASLSRSHSNQGSTTWTPESGSLNASPHPGRGSEATKVGTGLSCSSCPRPPPRTLTQHPRVPERPRRAEECKELVMRAAAHCVI